MNRMEGLEVQECSRCPALVESRRQIVNGTGPGDADVLFVGEGPGEQEDRKGEPFVGRSGSILDEKLKALGLNREGVRITNCVRCRPPDNRDPTQEELGNCQEWLDQEIDLIDPDVIVTLGKVPSQHLLGRDVAVTSEAGSVEEVEIAGSRRTIVICVHPAAALYDRSQEATLDSALEKAATVAGVERPDGGGQANLGDF